MEWEGRPESENVEDRRSFGAKGLAIGGGGSILLIVLALLFGADPGALLNQFQPNQPAAGGGAGQFSPEEERAARFVKVVLKDTEDVWNELFRREGRTYKEPTLVLFSRAVDSACGRADSSVGPFYCPGDEKLYIDLSFFHELASRIGAPGDFAEAYVIAHEVAHHVQNLLGRTKLVESQRRMLNAEEYNRLSVRLELQADFYAGVWAHYMQKKKRVLEPGDTKEALDAAAAIGDDRLQKRARGYVVPDSFTHGTSMQRVRWFRKGFDTGAVRQGDTFRVKDKDL